MLARLRLRSLSPCPHKHFFTPHSICVLLSTSFGIVCFEVATRTEPFKGKIPAQVIRAVLLRDERPRIPEWASVSPDILPLMQQCWKQEPAKRPEGFGPVVEALASVVSCVGDPRAHSGVAEANASSSRSKRGGDVPSVGARMASVTEGGGVRASSRQSYPALHPASAEAEIAPDTGNDSPRSTFGGGGHARDLGEGVSRFAATGAWAAGVDSVSAAPVGYLPTTTDDLLLPKGKINRCKKEVKAFDQKVNKTANYRHRVRHRHNSRAAIHHHILFRRHFPSSRKTSPFVPALDDICPHHGRASRQRSKQGRSSTHGCTQSEANPTCRSTVAMGRRDAVELPVQPPPSKLKIVTCFPLRG